MKRKRRRGQGQKVKVCVVCRTSSSSASNYQTQRKYFVNVCALQNSCGHMFCEICAEKKLDEAKTRYFTCPICSAEVKRSQLHSQSFEQVTAVRDREVRRKVAHVFNKIEEDFDNINQFNDFLEQAEDIVYKLVHHIDEEATERELEHYRSLHLNDIARNESRKTERRSSDDARVKHEAQLRMDAQILAQRQEHQLNIDIAKAKEGLNSIGLGEMKKKSWDKIAFSADGSVVLSGGPQQPVQKEMTPLQNLGLLQPQPLKPSKPHELKSSKRKGYGKFLHQLDSSQRRRMRSAGGFARKTNLDRSLREALCGL